ncbi:MAG: hypothetical protein HYV09_05840 [Deltaproteobacteria bacterium]|nr:hypothetical protein [Deltaproteobacteria bacterium]
MALTVALFGVGCGSTVEPVADGDASPDGDPGLDAVADGLGDTTASETSGDSAPTDATGDAPVDSVGDAPKDTAPDTSTAGALGAPCILDGECTSGICLSIGRCSKPCAGSADCPASSNWACVSLPGRGPACSCTVLAAEDVACNGVDDNCDGKIDETAKTCGTTCVDVKRDPSNCGGCGIVCGGGTVCQAGSCVCPAAKPTICGSTCVDLTKDPLNCGGCGTACPVGANGTAVCTAGACSLACTAPYGNCNGSVIDGCERDLRYDTANCGTCGKACSFANASALCSTGSCVINTCNTGFANCDFDPSNGCETNTASSTANCGGCGKVCAPANGTGMCVSGACDLLSCNTGWSNCNANAVDGCEINTQSDLNNCGLCGKVCPGAGAPNMTAACTTGTCTSACVTGWANCDGISTNGCEKNVRTDNANCGACGNACTSGSSCIDGICQAFAPVDVMILLGVTGSTQYSLDQAVPNLKARLVAPLLAMSGVNVGVSYSCDFPTSPYGVTGDRAFQGAVEPITVKTTIDSLITTYPKQNGGDGADGMIEALGSLAGLPLHPTSLAISCSSGRIAGGCWRTGAKKVVVLFTDDYFHNGPDPVSPTSPALYEPYTLVSPAPQTWPGVRAAMTSANIKLLIMNSTSGGTGTTAYSQQKRMLIELGQTVSDLYFSLGADQTGTASDAIVARVAGIRTGG